MKPVRGLSWRLLILLVSWGHLPQVQADTIWYLQLANNSNELITITPTGSEHWQCQQLCNTLTIPSGQTRILKSLYQPGDSNRVFSNPEMSLKAGTTT
ncbi:hypothetical protein [Endozoicomonas arenosclerae]|uniref:hypothetical protein n=1 Tax=Endozoicomonas arenosclerae TaxID=1633495 RepID=UPI000780C043|nr:hypothetical protein [Endozoicomonas arenosclerae]